MPVITNPLPFHPLQLRQSKHALKFLDSSQSIPKILYYLLNSTILFNPGKTVDFSYRRLKMKYRCVKCGHEVEKLYIQYSPGNIRLVKCSNCMSVADEYIECELMILMIDLILHKPKAYRHLLFNLLDNKRLEIDSLLLKSSLIFFVLDAYKLWILKGNLREWSILSLGVGIFGHALLRSIVFLCSFFVLSRKLLEFVEGFSSYKEVLLAILVSCYLKLYIVAMSVWDFPSSAVYITDLFVMSSNLVALRMISKSSFGRCVGVCISAHALMFFVHWVFQDL